MRQRKRDRHLPPCVFSHHGAYWYVKRKVWTRLGSDLGAALAAYAKLIQPQPEGTMPALITEALADRRKRIAPNTAKQYETIAKRLRTILADFAPEQVLPRHVVEIRRKLADHPGMANRALSVLRLVFDYALEQQMIDSNPARGIKRIEETARDRLISQAEFDAIRAAAVPRLQVIMDLCYLTGQRVGDVLTIRYADLGDDGIAFRQAKTGARLVVRWTPELRAAVDRAKALHGNVRALTLLHNRRGKAPDYKSTYIQWQTACRAAGVSDAHLHDIRAMSATDAEAQGVDAQALLGHTTPLHTRRYLRSKKVPQVSGPSVSRLFTTKKNAQ